MALRTLGDVIARSSTCITVCEDATVRTLALALAKHRVDAVPVLSADRRLVGIATTRDIAKAIARSLDLDQSPVSLVMTMNPVTLPPSETPANALSLMRQGRFRHIPVLSSDGLVLGVVDVLSLAYDAITRLQLSYSMIPSRRGYDLLRAARDTIEKPTLRNILDPAPPPTLSRTNTVAEACELIVTKHVAAVLIVDSNNTLEGIFTCTDVVKRVIAKSLDPFQVPISHVMTSNPDCAEPQFTILESLQRMQACGFRHLPVVQSDTRAVTSIVDVLQLASDTLLDLNSAASNRTNPSPAPPSNPASSAPAPAPAPTEPPRSGLAKGLATFFGTLFSNSYAQRPAPPPALPQPRSSIPTSVSSYSLTGSTAPPVAPRRSAEFTRNDPQLHQPPMDRMPTRRHYSYLASDLKGQSRRARADVPLASFKFKDINGDFRRIKVPMELQQGDFDQFVLDVRRRFLGQALSPSSLGGVKIKYMDEDGDDVLIANDDDLASCFEDVGDVKGKTIQLKVEEAEGAGPSSKIQSPVSSAPSSTVGSPSQRSISSGKQEETAFKPSVQPPPMEEPLRDPARPTGVYRTRSRPLLHTPSTLKASKGHQMMLERRIEEAIVLFTEALELDKENARAMGERGAAHLLEGSSVEAEEDYRGAIALVKEGKGGKRGDMTYQMCLVGLVESLVDQRRYEEAVSVASGMEQEWGNSGCVDAFRDELDDSRVAAEKAMENGEYGEAMNLFNNAIRVEGGYLRLVNGERAGEGLRLGRGKCYRMLGDHSMALEDYEAAVGLDVESLAGHKGCGKCLEALGRFEEALEAYERAGRLDSGDEEVAGAVERMRGLVPDPMQTKREEIAKLGALLGGLNLPGSSSKTGGGG